MKRYVIIGAGNAGLTCAKTIRKYDDKCEVVLISDENYLPYCRCLITYFIEKEITEEKLFEKNRNILKKLNIKYISGKKVDFIETERSRIKFIDGEFLEYDKLMISVGGEPKKPSFEYDNSILVTTLRTLDDAKSIIDNFNRGSTVVIEGGGLVSLKTLLALYKIGVKIYWVVKSPYILSYVLDRESAEIIEGFVKGREGIKLIKNCKIVEVKSKIVKLDNGDEIKADGVIVGKGVNARFINSDRDFNFKDGYIVNSKLETNIENIYAGGDCTIVYDIAHKTNWKVPLWPVAGEHGRFIGLNMVGKNAEYRGAVPVNSFSVFENEIIAGGKKRIFEDEKEDYYEISERKGNVFKKFIFDREKESVVGYVFINDIFYAGPIYYEVKEA